MNTIRDQCCWRCLYRVHVVTQYIYSAVSLFFAVLSAVFNCSLLYLHHLVYTPSVPWAYCKPTGQAQDWITRRVELQTSYWTEALVSRKIFLPCTDDAEKRDLQMQPNQCHCRVWGWGSPHGVDVEAAKLKLQVRFVIGLFIWMDGCILLWDTIYI